MNKYKMSGFPGDVKKTLRKFLKLHHEIKAKAKDIALLRKEMKVLKEEIGLFMKEKKVGFLDVGDADVVYKNTKLSASLSKDFLAASTQEFFKKQNPKLGDDVGTKFVEFLWAKKKDEGKERERVTIRKHRKRKAAKKNKDEGKKIKVEPMAPSTPATPTNAVVGVEPI